MKDLNDSQDPKHTLFCRENAYEAIYALFSDNKCPLFNRLGGGSLKGDNVTFFLPFFYIGASLTRLFLSVRISYLLPCLWTAASICDSGLEIYLDVHLHPRAVLPHHPQCVQDLPDLQGDNILKFW